jgi:thymidylate synthase (FAD)
VRHRIGSYSQESTRYCNYKSKGIKFIKPLFFEEDSEKYKLWQKAMENTADIYNLLIASGATPQEARSVLPNSLKTEIVVTFNLREWRHFFRLRCSKKAHPQMREVSVPLLREFKRNIPIIFDDISEE